MSEIYRLPLPVQSITGLGGNPLKEEWKHRDLDGIAKYMEFAWDFLVPVGTPVFASRDGLVYDVKVDSDVQGNPALLEAIYYGNKADFTDFLAKNQELVSQICESHPSIIKAFKQNDIDRAMWEVAQYYYENANRIILDHGSGLYSASVHLEKDGAIVKPGDAIKIGEQIGYSGNTGFSGAPHLHWEVYRPKEGVNPLTAFMEAKTESIDTKFDKEIMQILLNKLQPLLCATESNKPNMP